MANWWEAAPLVEEPKAQGNWWDEAPLVEAAPAPAPVDEAKAKRDAYYSSGIYAGSWNPLGPIARTIDAFASGAQRAPLFGWDDEAGAALNTGLGFAGDYEKTRQGIEADKQSQRQENPVASAAGELAGALALGQGFAGKVIQAGAPLWKVAGASALDGAMLGTISGSGEAQPGERLENGGYGALGGLMIGGAIPYATEGIARVAKKAITPFVANAERKVAADYLRGEGVNLTAGQRTGSDALRYAESELGGATARDMMEKQGEQFTAAALKRTGTTASRATPEVMDDAFNRIGQQFDDLASRNNLLPDLQLEQDLLNTARDYVSMVPDSHRAPIVRDTISDIANTLKQGSMDGTSYQALRSRLDRAARSSAKDPQLQDAMYGLRNSLDDAMERSIGLNNPQDAGAWKEVRRQYRNMLTVERAATGAGENAAQGLISPQALRNATVNTQGRRNYARGSGDFAELARSGVATMQPMPNSGTAGRLNAQNLGTGLSTAIGLGGAGYASGGDPYSMIMGAMLGHAAPRIAGKALMSGSAQKYLGNQAAANAQMTPLARALYNRILGIEASEEAPAVGRSVVGLAGFKP